MVRSMCLLSLCLWRQVRESGGVGGCRRPLSLYAARQGRGGVLAAVRPPDYGRPSKESCAVCCPIMAWLPRNQAAGRRLLAR